MSPGIYGAWRFVHPDFGAPSTSTGLRLTPKGGIELVEGEESVRQAIFLLLSTLPGERVMRPDYGCQLYQLVFMPNDDTTAGLAIYFVRRALERWEPRIDLIRVDAGRDPDDPARLNIFLEYRVRATRRLQTLTFATNLAGET